MMDELWLLRLETMLEQVRLSARNTGVIMAINRMAVTIGERPEDAATEERLLDLATRGVRAVVLRDEDVYEDVWGQMDAIYKTTCLRAIEALESTEEPNEPE